MQTTPRPVPAVHLYGDDEAERTDFWLHCELLEDRTHLHNWEISVHRHETFFQIFHLHAGEGEIVAGGGTMPFRSPCALFIPPDAPHGFRYSRDVDGLVMTGVADRLSRLMAADRHIGEFAAGMRIVPLDAHDADAAFVTACITHIHRELAGRAFGRSVILEPLLTAAIVSLVRANGRRLDGSGETARDRARLEELTTLIDTHFRDRPPIAFYAARLGLSPTHLGRTVRATTGMSIRQLIDRRVLDLARRDLIFTQLPVSGIADALGFTDPAYFNRFFRKQTGTTPGAFRAAERRRLAD